MSDANIDSGPVAWQSQSNHNRMMELQRRTGNQIAGFLVVEAADIAAAAGLFQDHPHITVFPGDGIDVMPVVTGPPED